MMNMLLPLRHIFEVENKDIDNIVFRLHYKLTSRLIIIFVILITFRGFLGEAINCMLSSSVAATVPRDVLNSFCWIQGTFSVPTSTNSDGNDPIIYPGVDKHGPEDSIIVHKYYPWVPFFLMAQGVFFYIPSFIWKSVEKRMVEQIVSELSPPIFKGKLEHRSDQLQRTADFVISYWGQFGWYASVYFGCEALNLVNVLGQMALTDLFLGGALFEFSVWGSTENSIPLFPRVAKCSFKHYGPTGDIQNYGAICVLPINIINEVVFLFLRVHFVVLAALTGMVLIFRLVLLASKRMRVFRLYRYNRTVNIDILFRLVQVGGISEWLFLNFLGKNMNLTSFKELVDLLDEYMPSADSKFKKQRTGETLL